MISACLGSLVLALLADGSLLNEVQIFELCHTLTESGPAEQPGDPVTPPPDATATPPPGAIVTDPPESIDPRPEPIGPPPEPVDPPPEPVDPPPEPVDPPPEPKLKAGTELARHQTFREWVRAGIESRCKLALCFQHRKSGRLWGLEFLAEVPMGFTFSAHVNSSFGRFLNERPATISVKGGVRFIIPNLYFSSISAYMSTRDVTGFTAIKLDGNRFEYDPGSIRRPYPGVSVGLFGDLFWLGFDIEELRNLGESPNPAFPVGATVARTITFTLAIPLYATLHQMAGNRKQPEPSKP